MKASVIRRRYLDYFSAHSHAIIPAAPIVPPDDSTTLFTGSGMQQLVPYLKGQAHPMGTRLVDAQPCFRADDIEEVGDNRHTTMFEMLGNWSLGDYFKKEQLSWVWEFFTQELSLDPSRLYVTLFAGDDFVPKDEESYLIWQKLGVAKSHIHYYEGKKNWWSRAGTPDNMPTGEIGGPTSEIFFQFPEIKHNPKYGKQCHPNCDCGRYLEIGNTVFLQYEQTKKGLTKLPAQNVDFGGGLERIVAAVNNTPDIFKTDLFSSIISSIEEVTGKEYAMEYLSAIRVLADHLRAATFMSAQGVVPSNKLQGYVMRRLLRRAVVRARTLGGDIKRIFLASISGIVKEYVDAGYLPANSEKIVNKVVVGELEKFTLVLEKGSRELDKLTPSAITEQVAFDLYQSRGFPFEITKELVASKNVVLNENKFNALLTAHQDKSRIAGAGLFKGGLADHSETVTKYHTATHLLHQALRDVLGDRVTQAGSNISVERLRFDYTCAKKPTPQEFTQITTIINEKIRAGLPVVQTIESKQLALDSGARAFFREKYPDKVSVYTIGHPGKPWYSKELCDGPHVKQTGEIGEIKIMKDENLGGGTRRIYVQLKIPKSNRTGL